jgi:hypothetical protein
MRLGLRPCLVLCGLAIAALFASAAAAGGAAVGSCSSFASQADAQARFAGLGGSPGHPVGQLDGDRDGIACEGLHGPYAAYATLGYNRKGGFLYGIASMPPVAGGEHFPCLRGNHKGPFGARRLQVYRARAGADERIGDPLNAEAQPERGELLWKAPRATLVPGRYYVAFEAKMRVKPYGRNRCPGFRSREVPLPAPRQPLAS